MRGRFVLLVEDDPADARLIQRAFERTKNNADVVRLQNGDDAVAYLAGQPPYENRTAYPLPTLLLLDIKLPRRSGHEILAWIRARQGELGRLPVVILTSSRQSVDVTRAYDLGANSYLVKPESAEQLAALAATFKAYWLELNQFPDTVSL